MSKSDITDLVDNLQDYDIFHPTKTIFFFDDVDKQSVERTIKNLHILDEQSGEVTIKLMTDGGSVEAGLALYDAIRAMKNHVRIICYGGVQSMGTVILQAGDTRLMTSHSFLMTHWGYTGGGSMHPLNKKRWDKLEATQDHQCNKIYMERIKEKKPRYTYKKLEEELLVWDTILSPAKAIEYGLADEIITGPY